MYDSVIISDIHLGSAVCQAKRLQEFLETLDGKTKELVLNGDVFDSWDFRRLKKTHWKILSTLRRLSDDIHVVWVNGNHDGPSEIISHLIGVDVVEEYVVKSGEKEILVLHGHRFDKFISDHPLVTAVADFFYRQFQRIDPSFWARRLKKASKTFLRCSELIESRAKEYAKKKGYDAVCCGHSHLEIAHPGEIGYFNSGCWTENICSYLTVLEGEISLRHFDGE